MNCETLGAALGDWLAGSLDAAQRAAFERHVEGCEPCRGRARRHAEFCCQRCVELLASFLDGELPPDEHEVLELHLCLCPPCGTYLESYRLTIELARRARGGAAGARCDELPAELARAILDALDARRPDGA